MDNKVFLISAQNLAVFYQTFNQSNVIISVALDDYTLPEVLMQHVGCFEKQGEGFDCLIKLFPEFSP